MQKMLAANSGFDFQDFAGFVTCIVQRRLRTAQQLLLDSKHEQEHCAPHPQEDDDGVLLWGRQLRPLHLAFDLTRAAHVLKQVQSAVQDAAARNTACCTSQLQPAGPDIPGGPASTTIPLPQWVLGMQDTISLAERAVVDLQHQVV